MSDNDTPAVRRGLTRRRFLQGSAAFGTAAAFGGFPAIIRAGNTRGADTPLRHVVISMQENRSFDHYFGAAPWIGVIRDPRRVHTARRTGWRGRAVSLREPCHAGRSARLGSRPRSVERRRHGRLLHERRHLGARLLHGRRPAVLLQPSR